MTAAFATACLALVLAADTPAFQTSSPVVNARRIYVAPMGQDHEAMRFRKLLSEGLVKQGFTIVVDQRDADATLATTLSTPVVEGHTRAYSEVALEDATGRRIWGGDFPTRKRWPSGADYVRKLADEIVSALHTATAGTR